MFIRSLRRLRPQALDHDALFVYEREDDKEEESVFITYAFCFSICRKRS